MVTHVAGRWICWGVSGLIFAVDTTCVVVDGAHSGHPIHGAIRMVSLAVFSLGGFLWLADGSRGGSHLIEPSEAAPAGGAVLDLDDARMIKRLDERLRKPED